MGALETGKHVSRLVEGRGIVIRRAWDTLEGLPGGKRLFSEGYSLPDDARFIVAGLSIEYLKKARGTITGECHAPIVSKSTREEYPVEVVMRDVAGDVVARATLRTLVGPKRPS